MVIFMKQRIITALIGVCVLVPVLFFSDTLVMPIAVALFASMGVWEMLGCVGYRNRPEICIPSMLIAITISLFVRYLSNLTGRNSYTLALIAVIVFVFYFYLMALAVISHSTKTIGDMALVCMLTMYITMGFASILMLRDIEHGQYLYLLVFIGAWMTDIFAYFVGRAIGRHKLTTVSPKKTVEGAIGGVVFCSLSFVLFGYIISLIELATPNYIELALTGLVISVISQFGDLIASLIKRQYGIKDYGKLFPGHGGVLDRFDSIIAIAPFLLMICSYPNVFSLFGA